MVYESINALWCVVIELINMEKDRLSKEFKCIECGRIVSNSDFSGTSHRNHCPFCGYSLHVDKSNGDRASECGGKMEPIGLMHKSHDELCIIHCCIKCGKINYNRIAADDNALMIESLLEKPAPNSQNLALKLKKENLNLLTEKDRENVRTQLYGKFFE